MTFDDVVNLIYSVDARARQRGRFECDHDTFRDLRRLTDGDGRHVLQSPMAKDQPWRLLGYPIYEGDGYVGLDFIGSTPLPSTDHKMEGQTDG